MRFARALKEKKGFVIKAVQEDGACLFRAVCKYKIVFKRKTTI